MRDVVLAVTLGGLVRQGLPALSKCCVHWLVTALANSFRVTEQRPCRPL